MNPFQCKQFTVQQDLSAMKVGTDSMLLGAWVTITDEVNSILDIGAGTGILSLMCAQQSTALTIDAVEIDENAYTEAVTNFENSPWADRLFCYHSSIQEFSATIDDTYDLIIANPPFFDSSRIKVVTARHIARETHLLNHLTLLKSVKKLLSASGSCAFILPYETTAFFIELAEKFGLFLMRKTVVRDTANAPKKRSLLQFTLKAQDVEKNELVLKNPDASYSQAFITLTRDFYLDF